MIRAVRVLLLVTIWVALWSTVSTANVLSGLLVASAIVLLFDTWQAGRIVVRPIHATRFALHFLRKLVEATVVVARTIVSPAYRVNTGIVAIPLRDCSDAVVTLIADAISLTPGTLTLEVRHDPLTIYVHALDVRDVDQVQADVRTIELLAIRAFGSAEAIASLTVDDSQAWRGR